MDADLKKPFSRAVAFAGKKNFMLNKLNADFFSLEILESEKLEEIVVKKTTKITHPDRIMTFFKPKWGGAI